jgi:hypothetical protein
MNNLIINIEDRPADSNRRFRIYLLNGDHYDIGFKKCKYYIDTGNKLLRKFYYKVMDQSTIDFIMALKPSQLLYETFILNGPSENIIHNINFFNKEIQKLI